MVKQMKKLKNIFIISIVIFLVDQMTKLLIYNNSSLDNSVNIIPNFFSITYTKNYGAAWSIMQNQRLFLIMISLAALLLICYIMYKEKKINKYQNMYYGFLIGGIVGNLFDRIIHGYVIDFFDFNIFGYNFPIFNISDIFIVVGIIMVIIETFLGGFKND